MNEKDELIGKLATNVVCANAHVVGYMLFCNEKGISAEASEYVKEFVSVIKDEEWQTMTKSLLEGILCVSKQAGVKNDTPTGDK